jgi:hypothetical protein
MANPQVVVSALDNRLLSIRKTTVAFASLFKDIPFVKYDENGEETEHFKVPIIYGNKEKYVKRLDITDEKVQITLPRIEYGLVSMDYDPSRRTNQANKIVGCSSGATSYVSSPMPYNFNFELVIYTRNIEDANQIMEYIIPFFFPDYNLKINMIPALGITKNIPITFNGESEDEDSTGSYDSPVRSVFRTLTFTARSYVYKPIKTYKPILTANTNIYISQETSKIIMASGNGVFVAGQTVWQGETYNSPSAQAIVDSWDATHNTLIVSGQRGSFVANTQIMNLGKSAIYVVGSIEQPFLAYNSIATPVPNTYPVTGPYTYNIIENDYTS